MMFTSTLTCFALRIRKAVVLSGAVSLAFAAASCEAPTVTKDFSVLNTATRIQVTDSVSRPLSSVTDAKRIKIARDFIQQYEEGWRSHRWQGPAISPRRVNFWDGNRYLGEFGINTDTITTDNYYQEAPGEEIARIAALFELKWPPPD
jgi:hypothetical protein